MSYDFNNDEASARSRFAHRDRGRRRGSPGRRPPAAAAPDPVARFHAGAGGAQWDQPFAIATTASLLIGDMTGTSESIEDVATGRYRTTTRLGPMTAGDGFDGTSAWSRRSAASC
jgi:hypothetical protein